MSSNTKSFKKQYIELILQKKESLNYYNLDLEFTEDDENVYEKAINIYTKYTKNKNFPVFNDLKYKTENDKKSSFLTGFLFMINKYYSFSLKIFYDCNKFSLVDENVSKIHIYMITSEYENYIKKNDRSFISFASSFLYDFDELLELQNEPDHYSDNFLIVFQKTLLKINDRNSLELLMKIYFDHDQRIESIKVCEHAIHHGIGKEYFLSLLSIQYKKFPGEYILQMSEDCNLRWLFLFFYFHGNKRKCEEMIFFAEKFFEITFSKKSIYDVTNYPEFAKYNEIIVVIKFLMKEYICDIMIFKLIRFINNFCLVDGTFSMIKYEIIKKIYDEIKNELDCVSEFRNSYLNFIIERNEYFKNLDYVVECVEQYLCIENFLTIFDLRNFVEQQILLMNIYQEKKRDFLYCEFCSKYEVLVKFRSCDHYRCEKDVCNYFICKKCNE